MREIPEPPRCRRPLPHDEREEVLLIVRQDCAWSHGSLRGRQEDVDPLAHEDGGGRPEFLGAPVQTPFLVGCYADFEPFGCRDVSERWTTGAASLLGREAAYTDGNNGSGLWSHAEY